jgi:hypothetical protein
MIKRLRTTSFAGFGAVLLALIVSGMVAAASLLTAVAAPEPDQPAPAVVDTTGTFEDLNGDGIDDDCQDAVVADEAAAATAEAAADLNGDGTISVSEAAQSDRTGGTNCNHGGYVSGVAHDSCAATDTETTDADAGETEQGDAEQDAAPDAGTAPTSDCTPADAPTDQPAQEQDQPATCEAAPTTDTPTGTTETETTDTATNHGQVVREVAQSDAVGGKNCNHGGAVSDASHKDNEARKATRDAAKAAAKAAREAARAAKHASKGHGHSH